MLARVSNLEAFRQWQLDDEQEVADLLPWLTGEAAPSPQMLAGTALHWALERATPGEFEVLQAPGYTFFIDTDADLALPEIREIRCSKAYGGLTVTGQVDAIEGLRVDDHKSTSQVNPERYFSGYQWRFYLDIHKANTFRWNVFEIREASDYYLRRLDEAPKGLAYVVHGFHRLEQNRYPGMHEDCARLAADYFDFAQNHMKGTC